MSGSAIVEISRSKKRYHDQDALLQGFCGHDGFTAKEVAVEVLDWKYEQYANAPKRAFDLQKLGYLEQLEGRECRLTGKVAHVYRVTDKGREHLRKAGMVVNPSPVIARHDDGIDVSAVNHVSAKACFSDIKSLLGGA